MADDRDDVIARAYHAGLERAFGYDTNRITLAEVLRKHKYLDLASLRRRPRTYLYDCDRGQGLVTTYTLDEARREAEADCGRNDPPRNLHLATDEELAFRSARGSTRG